MGILLAISCAKCQEQVGNVITGGANTVQTGWGFFQDFLNQQKKKNEASRQEGK